MLDTPELYVMLHKDDVKTEIIPAYLPREIKDEISQLTRHSYNR